MNQTPEYLQSELPAIELFQKLGYSYLNGLTDDERPSINDVILENRLKDAVRRTNSWLNDNNINNAFKGDCKSNCVNVQKSISYCKT